MRGVACPFVALLGSTTAFVPQAVFNPAKTSSTSPARAASTLRMGEEPLGVGVIGCGRIGDVSLVIQTDRLYVFCMCFLAMIMLHNYLKGITWLR